MRKKRAKDILKFEIDKKDWAPGVWAGVEEASVSLDPSRYIVENVDLINRVITLRSAPLQFARISFRGKIKK